MDVNGKFNKLTSIQKEAYIVKATLRALQELLVMIVSWCS